ncbi:hypothetical protein BJ878DRAFT_574254 [Calycina marina]|uniref:Uncharacterized protein n=1 Tax=Calycina marina TaxID=1763456 RepID=A0A9P7Z6I9_9HELO|nr:hypothetical protein BJ878DRAFT_574254 [Calycina marina]
MENERLNSSPVMANNNTSSESRLCQRNGWRSLYMAVLWESSRSPYTSWELQALKLTDCGFNGMIHHYLMVKSPPIKLFNITGYLALLGIAELTPDAFYFAAGNFSSADNATSDGIGSYAVFNIDLCVNSAPHTPTKILHLSEATFLNGLAVLSNKDELLVVTDTPLVYGDLTAYIIYSTSGSVESSSLGPFRAFGFLKKDRDLFQYHEIQEQSLPIMNIICINIERLNSFLALSQEGNIINEMQLFFVRQGISLFKAFYPSFSVIDWLQGAPVTA